MNKIKRTLTDIRFPKIFPFNNNNEIRIRGDSSIEYQRKRSCSKKNDEERSLNFDKRLPNSEYPIYRSKPRNMTRR